jgi:uncharacterized protein (UPF0333 family)
MALLSVVGRSVYRLLDPHPHTFTKYQFAFCCLCEYNILNTLVKSPVESQVEQRTRVLSPKSIMSAVKKRQSSKTTIEAFSNQEPTSPRSRGSGESRVDCDLRKRAKEDCETDYKTLARRETKIVSALRVLVLFLLLVTATLTSIGVYFHTSNEETQKFESTYQANAQRIVESFHDAVERRLGAINSMATAITSYSLDAKQTFPFVTIPNFEIRGSDLRVQADAANVFYMPLVTDETRVAWEDYALANRNQFGESFQEDLKQREAQDDAFGFSNTTSTRMLQQSQQENILDDGTGYHTRIWSNGAIAPRQDEPEGSGPYLPIWQAR